MGRPFAGFTEAFSISRFESVRLLPLSLRIRKCSIDDIRIFLKEDVGSFQVRTLQNFRAVLLNQMQVALVKNISVSAVDTE